MFVVVFSYFRGTPVVSFAHFKALVKKTHEVYTLLCLSSFTQILKWNIHYRNSMADFSRQKEKISEIQDCIWNDPVWGLKRKKNEQKWIEPKGPKGHHQQYKNTQCKSEKARRLKNGHAKKL